MSFAEPIPPLCHILDLLRQGGDVTARDLGIGFASRKNDPRPIVGAVFSDQPALHPGDLIVAVDGQGPIPNVGDLFDRLRGADASIPLTINRDGSELVVAAHTFPVQNPLAASAVYLSGLVISEPWFLDDALLNPDRNLRVHFIDYATPAEYSEAELLDLVEMVDGKRFTSTARLYEYLSQLPEDAEVSLLLRSETATGQFYFHYKLLELPVEGLAILNAGSEL